jgi:hypothetical protein
MVTRIFGFSFAEDSGKRYLGYLCKPLIDAVVGSHKNLEIEEARVVEATSTLENLQWILSHVKEFLLRLTDWIDLCPM